MLASHVRGHAETPGWFWWDSLREPQGIRPPKGQLRKAFLPCACYSRRGLLLVDTMHRVGWSGHFEVLVPTLLTMDGMVVTDLSQLGYATSSLRWRPLVTLAEFTARFHQGVIYHPVKEDWAWVDGQVQQFGR